MEIEATNVVDAGPRRDGVGGVVGGGCPLDQRQRRHLSWQPLVQGLMQGNANNEVTL